MYICGCMSIDVYKCVLMFLDAVVTAVTVVVVALVVVIGVSC